MWLSDCFKFPFRTVKRSLKCKLTTCHLHKSAFSNNLLHYSRWQSRQIGSHLRLSECVWNDGKMLIVDVKFPRLTCTTQRDLGRMAVLFLRPDGWTAVARHSAGLMWMFCVCLICLHTSHKHTAEDRHSSSHASTTSPNKWESRRRQLR